MKGIGGNTTIQLQVKTSTTKNEIGENIPVFETKHNLFGWLDFMGGEAKHSTYNAKIQESTHVFIGDFVSLDSGITSENSRVLDEGGQVYDVTLIDDPMKLHQQLEIYLKFTGGQ